MIWLWVNVALMVPFVALWVGIPTWLILKHPDRNPTPAATPAVRNFTYQPGPRRSEDTGHRRVA
jgi:hypothetical protein